MLIWCFDIPPRNSNGRICVRRCFMFQCRGGEKRWGKGGDSLQQGQGADLNHEFYCTVSAGTETGIVYIYI
jgi:hypothetical protein